MSIRPHRMKPKKKKRGKGRWTNSPLGYKTTNTHCTAEDSERPWRQTSHRASSPMQIQNVDSESLSWRRGSSLPQRNCELLAHTWRQESHSFPVRFKPTALFFSWETDKGHKKLSGAQPAGVNETVMAAILCFFYVLPAMTLFNHNSGERWLIDEALQFSVRVETHFSCKKNTRKRVARFMWLVYWQRFQ